MPLAALTRELADEIAREFPGLQRLNLACNALRDVQHLRLLPQLAQLDLSRNALQALPADLGAWLPRLSRLNLRGNQMHGAFAPESLAGLAQCRALVALDAGDNRVALLGELRHLAAAEALEELALDGNPVENRLGDAFRREALAMVARLRVLDGQAVTPAERLYSRLQVKSELVVSPVAQHEERRPEDREAADSPKDESHPSYTGSGRLLTPASVTREYEQSQEDADDAWVDLEGNPTIEQVRRRSAATSSHTSHIVSAHPSSPPDRSHQVNWTPREHEIQSPAPPGWQNPHPAPSPPHVEQLEVILDESGHSVLYNSSATHREHSDHTGDARIVIVKSPHPSSPQSQQYPASESSEVALLQKRVNALERILVLHDNTMQKELVQMAENRQSPPHDLDSREQAAQMYMKVLSMWREKVVALMVQLQSAELVQSASKCQEYKRVGRLEEMGTQLKLKCEMWEQRVVDTEAQRDLHLARVTETEKRCDAANARTLAAVRTMTAEREKLQRLAEMIVAFSASNGIVSEKMDELARAMKHIDAFQRQLHRIQDRLSTASLLVAHREARVRNTEAAMEAERRILVHQLEKLQAVTIPQSSDRPGLTTSDRNAVHANMKTGSAVHKLRRHRKLLRPATEAALRTLFHRLDVYETGLVHLTSLLNALRVDSGVMSAAGGDAALSSLVAHIELTLERKSKDPTLDVTLPLPKRPGSDKITWGEFLLLFLPETPSEAVIRDSTIVETVTADALALPCELCRSTLLRHVNVPKYDSKNLGETQNQAKSHSQRAERMTKRELITELLALRKDRDELRRRVLADAHDLQSRAAKIRKEWQGKVEHLACENDDLRRAVEIGRQESAALRKQCEEAERSAAAVQHALDNLRRDYQVRDADYSREKQLLERQQQESLRREQDIWKKELEDVGFQHSALQAEHVKQQAYLRHLERELASTKEHMASKESERVSSLEGRVAKRDEEISKLRRERNSLLSTLRDQERKLAVQTESVDSSVQTDEVVELEVPLPPDPVSMRSVASQTVKIAPKPPHRSAIDETMGSRPARRDGEVSGLGSQSVASRHVRAARMSPEDITQRLERLQSLTASLLDD